MSPSRHEAARRSTRRWALVRTEGADAASVVDASDVTILCLPSSPDVVAVLDAAFPALGPGKIVVDTSTIHPDVEREQHARVLATGAGYLEAPLSGGTVGAQKGQLTLMVGGEAETLTAARPALDTFAGLIVHVGGPGMGQVVKLCNNLIYAAQMLATSEATVMAQQAGVEMEHLYEILTHATGDCVAVRTRLPGRGRDSGQSRVERLGPGVHDRPHGQGSRSGDRLRRAGGGTAVHIRDRAPDPRFGERGGVRPRGLLGHGQGDPFARRTMTVLTLDLGTSATKAALWDDDGLVAITRSEIATVHPRAGWAEQDPRDWWRSVVDACTQLRGQAPSEYLAVDAVGFAAARETFAPFDDDLRALGPGILWSDQRGGAGVLHFGDPDEFRARTGVVLNAACCAAKIAWLVDHEAGLVESARWLLAPRDLVVAHLTGQVLTDETLASRTGLYGLDGRLGVIEPIAPRLPPVHPATTVVPPGGAGTGFDELGLRSGVTVVLGGGDRACEVVGTGAGDETPMVSWGTTTNVSIPHPGPIGMLPTVAAASRGALGGYLLEAGLSASGAGVDWLERLTGRPAEVLLTEAAASPPGANGVIALPWLQRRASTMVATRRARGVHGSHQCARAR